MPLSDYDQTINAAADEWNLDPRFLKAVLLQENRQGNPRAVSKAGAIGIGQLMPDTAKGLGVTDPTDPVQSIYGAAKYLDTALTAEGTPARAALYYHGGPGWRQNYGPESQAYVPGVVKNYASLAPPQQPANNAAAAPPAPASTQPARVQVASATPKTATDATPGGNDPLSLLPPAPQPSAPAASAPAATATKGGTAAANDDDPLKLLPPAPKAVNQPSARSDIAWKDTPDAPYNPINAAAVNLWKSVPKTDAEINALLAPTPGTDYGGLFTAVTPEEAKAGTYHFAMGSIPRSILQGFATPLSEAGTVDPIKGTYGADPNMVMAALSLPGAANPLLFSREQPSMMPSFSDITKPRPTTVPADLPYVRPDMSPSEMALTLQAQERLRTGRATPSDLAPPSAPPPSPSPVSAAAPGEAKPAGAMVTPPGAATFTPAEVAAYRSTAEGNKLMENQPIGVRDTNEYIPGVTVNAAEREQQVEIARELKSLGLESPAITQDMKAAAEANTETRKGFLKDVTGSDTDIHNRTVQRQTDIEEDKTTVFAPDNIRGDVSTQPLLDHMEEVANRPINRENTPLQTVFRRLRERLTDADGNARTMGPEQAWGLRQDIDRMVDPMMKSTDPNPHMVARQLNDVADVLDASINDAAPGYQAMIDKYKAHSQALQAMDVLQKKTLDMLSKSSLRYSDFQRFMKTVVDMRRTPVTDQNAYKFISDETMDNLWRLRDDLRRSATAQELARAPGSDTVPNIIDMLKRYGTTAAIHGVANYISPGWGSMAIRLVQEATEPARVAKAAAQNRARAGAILNPPEPLRPLDPY